ncbi:transcription factor-like protein DPA isoform X3 [Camellia sinensis]|uniref:transcription factor-like protein DPA isoform X3 n=1 Tax=Camellia sinensis TaxID=4442 RepID=UPI0010363E35|nr:transcription factor-like protein DPA isoform X3 [Camellia sinensis]
MDNGCLGDIFDGFGQKHSGGEGSIPALTSDNSTAAAYKDPQISNQLSIHHDGSATKKKRVSRIIGGGLRQFSIIICKKVESKGKTTYSEVADEIIAELTATNNNSAVSLDEALRVKAMNRIEKKAAYLKELEEQIAGLQNLMLRNQQLLKSGNAPFGGFSLPFIVVRTNPHATVEIEISEDMQLVHLDFNSTPFSLHDDAYILKLLWRYQLPESTRISPSSSVLSSSSIDVASGGTKPFYWNSETETAKVYE